MKQKMEESRKKKTYTHVNDSNLFLCSGGGGGDDDE